VTNFGTEAVPLPDGVVRVASGVLTEGLLPGETTVWLTEWPDA
jgi:alpha-glucosidase